MKTIFRSALARLNASGGSFMNRTLVPIASAAGEEMRSTSFRAGFLAGATRSPGRSAGTRDRNFGGDIDRRRRIVLHDVDVAERQLRGCRRRRCVGFFERLLDRRLNARNRQALLGQHHRVGGNPRAVGCLGTVLHHRVDRHHDDDADPGDAAAGDDFEPRHGRRFPPRLSFRAGVPACPPCPTPTRALRSESDAHQSRFDSTYGPPKKQMNEDVKPSMARETRVDPHLRADFL